MARAAGRDVVVELRDAVAQLKTSQARQDEDIERIVVRLGLMSEHSVGMAARLDKLTAQMESVTAQMESVTAQMRELADDQLALREDFVTLGRRGRELQAGLGRLSGILVRALESTDERFDEVEARLTKLEKKTG